MPWFGKALRLVGLSLLIAASAIAVPGQAADKKQEPTQAGTVQPSRQQARQAQARTRQAEAYRGRLARVQQRLRARSQTSPSKQTSVGQNRLRNGPLAEELGAAVTTRTAGMPPAGRPAPSQPRPAQPKPAQPRPAQPTAATAATAEQWAEACAGCACDLDLAELKVDLAERTQTGAELTRLAFTLNLLVKSIRIVLALDPP